MKKTQHCREQRERIINGEQNIITDTIKI
jgi:hypothetical protein